MNTLSIGAQAEALAVAFLQQQAVKVLQCNFNCKYGEIDIISQQENMVSFIEVRYRKNNVFGTAAESINFSKRQKIINTAQYYLQTNPNDSKSYRFDVVVISNSIQKPKIEWIKDAFNA